ncbi:hypothetical protein C2845_PM05G17060 [Panicum miliaceum]|uniref:Uncharacterized protein n=1 Tax=Panicum miliaceum TaxID=4540 RepID=A0A3L6T183_PANMI|nr:hypothetical protein C2845_PM05G17060 [Panicum miliaceum]
MPNQRERRTKRRLDSPQDPNVGGSSHADVGSGRTLRTRGQKRAPSGDIEGGSNGSSSNSSDNEVEDENYRVEHRTGKGPAEVDSEDEEGGGVGADGSDDDEGDGSEDENANDVEPPPPPMYAAPPPPSFGDIPSSSHEVASYQGMPPPPLPHRPSAADQMAANMGASLFDPTPNPSVVHQWDITTPSDNGDDQ